MPDINEMPEEIPEKPLPDGLEKALQQACWQHFLPERCFSRDGMRGST